MNLTELKIMHYVEDELKRARDLHPSNKHRVIAISEEYGELMKAILDYQEGKGSRSEILLEGIQAISMILRFLTESDDNFNFEKILLEELI